MSDKVKKIKAEIQAGTYQLDIETTAEKLFFLYSLDLF